MKRKGSGLRNQGGFTLVELIVVMVIIGLLASFVYVKFIGRVGESKQNAAKAQIEIFNQALELYRLDTGQYPSSEQGLNALNENPGVENYHVQTTESFYGLFQCILKPIFITDVTFNSKVIMSITNFGDFWIYIQPHNCCTTLEK